jgi:hypothetical protein
MIMTRQTFFSACDDAALGGPASSRKTISSSGGLLGMVITPPEDFSHCHILVEK